MSKDFYSTLGVSKSASPEEIKKSFRRLAHEHHPDKGGDAQKFKDVNEAYQVLGDADKRKQYDQFGSAAFENGGMGAGAGDFGGFGGFGGQQGGFSVNMEDMGDLGEMFGGMFGFGGRGSKQKRGQNIEVDVTLDFLESVKGVDKDVKLYKHDSCSTCDGSGAEKGSAQITCKTCNGKGQVQHMQRTIFGNVQMAAPCAECHGTGKIPEKPCHTCKGVGIERREKELTIHIPAGISEGEAMRIDGEGEYPGKGGKAGDLYVRIHVKQHSLFVREGNDVHTKMDIPFTTLALGGEITIQTVDGDGDLKIPEGTPSGSVFVDGDGDLKIPEGTPSGSVFRVRGKGVPFLRSNGRGDQYVTVQAEVKQKLSREQKKVLEDLKAQGL